MDDALQYKYNPPLRSRGFFGGKFKAFYFTGNHDF